MPHSSSVGKRGKGKGNLAADLVFCDFRKASSNVTSVEGPGGETAAPVNYETTSSLTGYMVSLTGNYSLGRWPDADLDLLGGLRFTHIGTTLEWNFAAGAGTSKFTWQALLGVSYSFEWGDLLLVYRYLSFEQAMSARCSTFTFQAPHSAQPFVSEPDPSARSSARARLIWPGTCSSLALKRPAHRL